MLLSDKWLVERIGRNTLETIETNVYQCNLESKKELERAMGVLSEVAGEKFIVLVVDFNHLTMNVWPNVITMECFRTQDFERFNATFKEIIESGKIRIVVVSGVSSVGWCVDLLKTRELIRQTAKKHFVTVIYAQNTRC